MFLNTRSVLAITLLMLPFSGCAHREEPLPRPVGADLLVQGHQALQQGDQQRAVESLQAALNANPDLITPRAMLGDLYRAQHNYPLAVQQYEQLVQMDKYYPINFYNLGLSYQFEDRLPQASDAYLHALKLDPADPKSTMNLGLVYLSQGQSDPALSQLERATELDQNSSAAWANLGVALDAKGLYPRAESAYRRSLELDENQTVTLLNLGSNLILQHKAPDAVRFLEMAVRREDSALARKRLADAYVLAHRDRDARDQYQYALQIDPRYVPALNALATLLIQQYRAGSQLDDSLRTTAVSALKQSLAVNSNQPAVAESLKKWDRASALSK